MRVADDVPAPGQRGKIFSGALLERDDGEKWVIDYNPESPFRVFRDRRVRLEGHRYRPESQALINPHVRVSTLTLVGDVPTDLAWIRVGPERCVTGSFRVHTWPPGTKLAGEPQRTFVVDHTQYSLASALGTQAPVDVAITVIAREVEPAPLYAARPGGPHLWITRIVEDCWWSYETRTSWYWLGDGGPAYGDAYGVQLDP